MSGEEGTSELVDTHMGAEERASLLMEVDGSGVEGAEMKESRVVADSDKGNGESRVVDGESGDPSIVTSGGSDVDKKSGEASVGAAAATAVEEPGWVRHLRAIFVILGGETTIALHQEFLIRNNNSDLQILKNTKVFIFVVVSCWPTVFLSSCLFFLYLSLNHSYLSVCLFSCSSICLFFCATSWCCYNYS